MNQVTLGKVIAVIFILSFVGCSSSKVKTYVDPSIQSNSVKSIAVFSLRNTAVSPGEALQLDRALTQEFLKRNPGLKIFGSSESNQKLNEASLVEEYSKFLYDFEHSGIPNINTLKKIGQALGVDAILQGSMLNLIQRDGDKRANGQGSLTSLTLRYTLLSTSNGSTLWEGKGEARKTGATVFSNAAPIYEVLEIAQKKILGGLPTLGNK